jgi:hypothetical protein
MKQSYFKIEFSMSLFSELFYTKVHYGSRDTKHPSNVGRVSGEVVSFAGHIFYTSPVF